MADRQWYTGRDGKQEGPFSDERLRELIASGMVRGDTLVWSTGMANWTKAADVPGLMLAQRVPSMAPGAAESGAPIGPLSLDVGVWALFWRAMILGFSELAVIPLPWIAPIFIRWFVERIQLPGGWRVGFVGRAEDIWWVFIVYALCAVAGVAYSPLQLLANSASGLFGVADCALVLHQSHLRGADGAAAVHRRILADAGMERASAAIRHHHHRLGLGRHRLGALDVPERAGLLARACFHRQRLGLSVAGAGRCRHRHSPHSDPVDRARVHGLARLAICAR